MRMWDKPTLILFVMRFGKWIVELVRGRQEARINAIQQQHASEVNRAFLAGIVLAVAYIGLAALVARESN